MSDNKNLMSKMLQKISELSSPLITPVITESTKPTSKLASIITKLEEQYNIVKENDSAISLAAKVKKLQQEYADCDDFVTARHEIKAKLDAAKQELAKQEAKKEKVAEGKIDDLNDAKAEKEANAKPWEKKSTDKKSNTTTVKGNKYGGSKQADDKEDLDESRGDQPGLLGCYQADWSEFENEFENFNSKCQSEEDWNEVYDIFDNRLDAPLVGAIENGLGGEEGDQGHTRFMNGVIEALQNGERRYGTEPRAALTTASAFMRQASRRLSNSMREPAIGEADGNVFHNPKLAPNQQLSAPPSDISRYGIDESVEGDINLLHHLEEKGGLNQTDNILSAKRKGTKIHVAFYDENEGTYYTTWFDTKYNDYDGVPEAEYGSAEEAVAAVSDPLDESADIDDDEDDYQDSRNVYCPNCGKNHGKSSEYGSEDLRSCSTCGYKAKKTVKENAKVGKESMLTEGAIKGLFIELTSELEANPAFNVAINDGDNIKGEQLIRRELNHDIKFNKLPHSIKEQLVDAALEEYGFSLENDQSTDNNSASTELAEIAKLAGLPPAPPVTEPLVLEDDITDDNSEMQFDQDIDHPGQGNNTLENIIATNPGAVARFKDTGMLSSSLAAALHYYYYDKLSQQAQQDADDDGELETLFAEDLGISLSERDLSQPGNEFTVALETAKASGNNEFDVNGTKYTVKEGKIDDLNDAKAEKEANAKPWEKKSTDKKSDAKIVRGSQYGGSKQTDDKEELDEDVNASISATGEDDVVNLIRKLSGLAPIAPNNVAEPESTPAAELAGIMVTGSELDEERDIEYTNTPREITAPVSASIPSGTDLNRGKKQYRKEVPGDNPMAVQEATLWDKYTSMLKGITK